MRVLNPSLRFKDEFVRHKILDALGDFYLLGHPLIGHIQVYRGGHSLHMEFIKTLMSDPSSWSWVMHADPEVEAIPGEMELENYTASQLQ